MKDYRLKMLLEVRFRGSDRDDAFFAFTRWWKAHANAYEVRALEVTTLSEEAPPPAVEISAEEDLL